MYKLVLNLEACKKKSFFKKARTFWNPNLGKETEQMLLDLHDCLKDN